MADEVLVSVADGIMTVTINRPAAKNAINRAASEGIAAAMERLDSDVSIRAAILTGADNCFCAGMDLKAFITGELPVVKGRGFAGIAESPPKKPLIAAVEGYALAGGLELVLSCDLVVSANNAKFGIPEVKRGLAAGAGGLMRLPRRMPAHIAMELALTGDFISAQRAYEVGFVNRLAKPGTALQVATELAKTIAANGPMSVAASKQVIVESQDWDTNEMFARQAKIVDPVFASKDAIEGATAFAQKRAPVWKGC